MREPGKDFGIEAFFLGFLAFIVFGVVLFAAFNTRFGGENSTKSAANNPTQKQKNLTVSNGTITPIHASSQQQDIICQCYNAGFELASTTNRVQSNAYRTGFSQCRSIGDVEGGNAWTAGWEARLSGRTYEATCKAYKRHN